MSDVYTKLFELEKRIMRLEQGVKSEPTPNAPPQPVFTSPQAAKPTKSEPQTSNLLGFFGAACFIFACILLIKLSIDSGWLTPGRQLLLSTFFGLSLILTAFIPFKNQRRYLSLLPAAGIVILNLTVYGGFFIHQLFSAPAALILTSGISVFSIYLFQSQKFDFYLVTAIVGTYLGPLFFTTPLFADSYLVLYYFVWSVVFSGLSIHFKSRNLVTLASYFALFSLSLISFRSSSYGLIATIQFLQFLVFLISVFLYSTNNKSPLTKNESWTFLPLLLFFYGSQYWLLSKLEIPHLNEIALAFTAFLFVVQYAAEKMLKRELETKPMIHTLAALILFHTIYLNMLPDALRPMVALFLCGLFFMFTPKEYSYEKYFGVYLTLFAVFILGYIGCLFDDSSKEIMSPLTSLLYGFGLLLFSIFNKSALIKKEAQFVFIMSAHLQSLLGFYRLADHVGVFYFTGLTVSIFWILYALFVLFLGFKKKNFLVAKSSLLILGLCTFKVFIFDVNDAGSIARIVSLIALGATLYGVGLAYKKIEGLT